jgi:hypothetical protein
MASETAVLHLDGQIVHERRAGVMMRVSRHRDGNVVQWSYRCPELGTRVPR